MGEKRVQGEIGDLPEQFDGLLVASILVKSHRFRLKLEGGVAGNQRGHGEGGAGTEEARAQGAGSPEGEESEELRNGIRELAHQGIDPRRSLSRIGPPVSK